MGKRLQAHAGARMIPESVALSVAWPSGAVLAAALAAAAMWLERRAGSPWRHAWLRAVVVALLVAATTRPAIELGAASPTVVLADRSSSVEPGAVDTMLAELGLPRAGVAVVAFGDESGSPLSQAIDEGVRALPADGRLLLLTDGLATGGDPERSAARAANRDVSIGVVPLPARAVKDAAVVRLLAPAAHRVGDPVPVTVAVQASEPLSGTLVLNVNGAVVESVPVALDGVGSPYVYRTVLGGGPGVFELGARIQVEGDERVDNDFLATIVQPAEPLEVLVVGEPEGTIGLADQLEAAGAHATVVGSSRVPGRLSEIAAWDVIVLVDVPARELGVDQLANIEAFVGDLGRGLVMTGGRQSYLAGGWQSTSLERLAPVRLEPAPHGTRDPVALVFMIDQSASMGTADGRTGVSKLDLAREAAALSADVLHPGDTVGVVAYDDTARWLVPLTTTGTGLEMADLQRSLAGLTTGGGTRIREALETGLPSLANLGDADADVLRRHAVLITDGRDFHDDAARNESAVRNARASGVTLSTIAIGFDADRPMLRRLASLGRGRYHSADDPSDLPRLAVEESEIARANAERRGAFQPLPAGTNDHPALHGVETASLPQLEGYVSVSPRGGADIVMESPTGDVLLATWQYGVGRVMAWTSDVGEAWARDWKDSPDAARFWRRMLGYVARSAAVGPPGVAVELSNGLAHVVVDAVDEDGRTDDLARVTARTGSDESSEWHELLQTAPGRYEVAVPMGEHPASMVVRVEHDGDVVEVPAAPVRRPPSEAVPGRRNRIPGIVQASSGRVWSAEDREAFRTDTKREHVPLWQVLLMFGAVLWLVDVARQTGTPEVLLRADRLRLRRTRDPAPYEEEAL